jgi:hypothetical protein
MSSRTPQRRRRTSTDAFSIGSGETTGPASSKLREEHVRSIRNKLKDRPSAADHTVDKIGMLWGFAKEHLEMKLGAAIRFCSPFFRSFPAMANTFSCRSVATATGKPVSRT